MMVSIEVRNASRRLIRPYFSKLGRLANVIWRIAFSIPLLFYEKGVRLCDLFRASLSEQEKESDRDQVRRYLALIASALAARLDHDGR
jgi:hypothetical protein